MSTPARRRLLDPALALLVGGAAFALYAATLAPTVLAGDGGEFQFVPYLLGVAHPTGYPLYTLLGWAWSHLLPLGDVAYRMNLFSAFWAALAAGLSVLTSSALLRQALPDLTPAVRRLLALLAASLLAVTPTLWSQALIAEVYGLHIFWVVLLLYLVLTWGQRRRNASPTPAGDAVGRKYLLLTALCFGLSLTHHSTTLLLAPALLAYVWLTDRRALRDWRRVVLPVLALMLLPLLLYLYIPWRAPHTPYLRLPLDEGRELVLYENSLPNLLRFITGGPFGGSVDLSVDLGKRLAQAAGFLLAEVGWPGVLLALLGVAQLALSRRWALLALTGLAYLVSVAFNLVYTIGDIFVLYIPSYLIVVLWLAVGVGGLARLAGRRRTMSALLVLPFFALPLWLAATHWADVDQSHNRRAATRWQAILSEPLPSGAILVSNDRNNIMPLWYYQYVEGQRPDLLGLFPLITADYPELGQVLDLALSTGRPTYLIKEMAGVEVKVAVEPEGSLWRIRGLAAEGEPAHPLDLRLGEGVALVGYDRWPHSPRPGQTLRVSLYWQPLRPLEAEYHTFVHLLDAGGQTVAQSDQQPGGTYYPTSLWQPGERLRDDHELDIPPGTPDGVYTLLAGMYSLAEDGTLLLLGEPAAIGQVGVKSQVPTEVGPVPHRVEATFGEQIELLGYGTETGDDGLRVTLHWRCRRPPKADYSVFVHLLDAGGQVVAQHDGWPQGGAYPFSVCDEGEVVVDEHPLLLPADLPAGSYGLRVGLYLLESGRRLPTESGSDSVDLGPVELPGP